MAFKTQEQAVGREAERARKRGEILAVAQRLFVDEGYEASAMGRIAKQAGVAPNTIYWYFADKDALLLAVLDGMLAEALGEYQERRDAPLEAQVLWLLDVLRDAERLIVTIHARLTASPAIRQWHDRFHLMLESMMVAALRERGVPEAKRALAARTAMYVFEGLLAHPTPLSEQHALVRFVVSTLEASVPSMPSVKGDAR